ncbi:MAG: metallophosphoesterase [Vicinamibacterales bacterium]
MRRVVHLSDLHFGRADPVVVDALLSTIRRLAPHLAVVSGDLTQRARRTEFREARAFLDALPCPCLVVPGNHDVPLYDLGRRFLNPLGRFRHFITPDLRPVHRDEEYVAIGLNTTRAWTVKDGTIRLGDLEHALTALQEAGLQRVKLVVAHHPFETRGGSWARMMGRAPVPQALMALSRAGADVFLTGHLHVGYTGHTAARYRMAARTAIVVEGGTATSTRMRGEANSFSLICIERRRISVERWVWQPAAERFVTEHGAQHFDASPSGWLPVDDRFPPRA